METMQPQDAQRTEPRSSRRFVAKFVAVCAFLFWVACDSFVPVQGWDEKLGPVIPHDTFPADCALCHRGSDWHTLKADFRFDHAKETGVELQGAHAQAACLLCHNDRGPVSHYANQGCAGCHADPHRGQMGRNCTDCHDQKTWRPNEMIARHDRTRLPLVGAHAATACFRCHPGAQVGNFAGADSRCEGCHAGQYLRSSYDHVASGYTTDCDRCHRPTAWKPAQFAHPSSFPLTFGHGNRLCTECHTPPNYAGLSTTCSSCHLDDYNATNNPPHAAANFSTNCAQCHNTRGWTGANFLHSPSFPLTNGHAGRACTACHTGGVWVGLSTTCSSCHLDTYQATRNPNHSSFGIPTTCEQCHNTVRWGDGTFTHSFPITTGAHAGFSCNQCHTTGVGNAFSCTHCHEHNQSSMNSEHNGVSGYQWLSSRCYQCHPNGRG
jgi:hypothetical protein